VAERDRFEGTREEVDRAIRSLRILEVVIGLAAVALAIGGGAVVAFVLSAGTDLSFRLVWGITAVLLLVVPTVIFLVKDRWSRQDDAGRPENHPPSRDG
jgi:hypothetical protein